MRAIALAAVAALAVLPVTGCGEDQKFIDDYNEATKPLSKLSSDLGTATSAAGGQSNSAIAKEFEGLAKRTGRVNADLAELDAPDDAKQDFDDLKAALKQGERHLRGVATAAGAGEVKQAGSVAQELVKDGMAIEKAENAVKQKVED